MREGKAVAKGTNRRGIRAANLFEPEKDTIRLITVAGTDKSRGILSATLNPVIIFFGLLGAELFTD